MELTKMRRGDFLTEQKLSNQPFGLMLNKNAFHFYFIIDKEEKIGIGRKKALASTTVP